MWDGMFPIGMFKGKPIKWDMLNVVWRKWCNSGWIVAKREALVLLGPGKHVSRMRERRSEEKDRSS